jgi:hypothetical protein
LLPASVGSVANSVFEKIAADGGIACVFAQK